MQQKRLHTVLHAMEDHRRRQSQFFKFETPDPMVSRNLVYCGSGAGQISRHQLACITAFKLPPYIPLLFYSQL